MQFPMFEHLKKSIQIYRKQHGRYSGTLLETGTITAISAGAAGSVAAIITTPIDVIKTRIMLSAAGEGTDGGMQAAKVVEAHGKDVDAEIKRAQMEARGGRAGGIAVGREIFRTEGVKGLFRGGALRGIWTALGSGLYLSTYESGRSWLENRRTGKKEGPAIG